MSSGIGIGISTALDSFAAGKEAARIAYYRLGRVDPSITIAFVSPIFNHGEVIRGIRSVLQDLPLLGCSTIGVITSQGSFRNSVAVCALDYASVGFSYGIGNNLSKNSRSAGSKAARQASQIKDITRQVYIILSDALSGNATDILRGAQEVLGMSFPIIGGPATDDLRFQKTHLYLNRNIYTDSVVGLLISGNIKVNIGSSHGWQRIGRPHKITKYSSNILEEINRKKAIEVYEEYLGKSLNELKMEGIAKLGCSYPLGMRVKGQREHLIRAPLKIQDNGSLRLSAEFPKGEDINLMIGDVTLALKAVKAACIEALRGVKRSEIKFAIVFSDIGRFQLLRKDLEGEVEIIKDILGKDVPFFGCYTCGQFAPVELQEYSGQSFFHNQLISIAIFS